jgi:phage terminase large subunit-like protein
VFILVGRGNGKSELAAALTCDALFIPEDPPEPGGHVYSAAAKREQTRYVFEPICQMIRNCPEMDSRAQIYKNSIVVGTRSYYPMSRETHTGTEHGGAPAFAVADEVHAHLDRKLINAIETGMIKRSQPLLVAISTSDFEREGSPCNQMHDYGSKVRDNLVTDPTFLPAIFEATKEDDWTTPATWRKANPNLGVTIEEDDLRQLCEKAKADPPFENEFKRLHCNIRTEQSERLLPVERWDACKGELPDLSKKSCWCGLDPGATSDFTAFLAVFPLEPGLYAVVPRFWLPEATARKRRERLGTTYQVWERQDALTLTPGNEIDYRRITQDIAAFSEQHAIQEVAVDALFQGHQVLTDLRDEHGLNAFEHQQGWKHMAIPTRTWIEHVGEKKIVHDGNPVMRWMVSNLMGRLDRAGNVLPDKEKSGDKIDGVVACIMALGRAVMAPPPPPESIYADGKRGAVWSD